MNILGALIHESFRPENARGVHNKSIILYNMIYFFNSQPPPPMKKKKKLFCSLSPFWPKGGGGGGLFLGRVGAGGWRLQGGVMEKGRSRNIYM